MSVGERFRAGGPRRVARFIAEHQSCDRGFGIVRPGAPGNPRLRIRCNGCGESLEYAMGSEEEITALEAELSTSRGGNARPRGPRVVGPAGEEAAGPRGRGRPAFRRAEWEPPRIHPWLINGAIAALVVAGLALIGIGLLGGSDDEPAPQSGEAAVTAPQPATTTGPATPSAIAPSVPPPPPPAPQAPAPAAQAPRLHRDRVHSRFDIGVPQGWRRESVGEGMAFAPASSDVSVRVFFEEGGGSEEGLAEQASEFLADEHGEARISRPRPTRLAGERAVELEASYRKGVVTAVVTATLLSEDGIVYLILRRVDDDSTPADRVAAKAVADSFRPVRG